jgi:hypothetical protein
MNRLASTHVHLNRSTSDNWESFAGHRDTLTELILKTTPARGRVCILGAGNCNDIDLARLLESCAEVHLVDLDEEALRRGVERQCVSGQAGLHLHGNVDVTACLDDMTGWSSRTTLTDADVQRCVTAPSEIVTSLLPAPFDAVVSACLLSQVIDSVVEALEERHPRFIGAVQAVRLGHLRLLARLIAPAGSGILCTDIVSSDTVPELATVAPGELFTTLRRLVEAQNFFHGLNPAVLDSVLRTDPALQAQIAEIGYRAPWLWHQRDRCYAVLAATMRKRAA